jgi:hypothetical protein
MGSFAYQGTTSPYALVGTDPGAGSQTAAIPVVIIPVTFAFSEGTVLSDGCSTSRRPEPMGTLADLTLMGTAGLLGLKLDPAGQAARACEGCAVQLDQRDPMAIDASVDRVVGEFGRVVLGRGARAQDIAAQVVTFCRAESITGQALVIDGGMPGGMH